MPFLIGTRSVQLLNGYSEPIGMSYLLINVTTVEHEESDQDKAIRTLTQQVSNRQGDESCLTCGLALHSHDNCRMRLRS